MLTGLEHVRDGQVDHGEAGLVQQLKLKQEGGQVASGGGVEVQAGAGQEQHGGELGVYRDYVLEVGHEDSFLDHGDAEAGSEVRLG